jgi:hypothetical protein
MGFQKGETMTTLNIRIALFGGLLLALGVCSAAAKAETPSTQPSSEASSTTPKKVRGKWIYGSVSPLTYWDSDTGKFLGNARGSAGIYEFDASGNYKEYTYIEMRTYGLLTTCWTVHEGKVAFNGNTFTIRPTKGHYKSDSGSRHIDRDMTPEELEKGVKTYNWKVKKDDNGVQHFIIPFDDGSSFDYHRDETK